MRKRENAADGLIRYLEGGVSPFHTAGLAAEEFERAGYRELGLSDSWALERGRGYYVRACGSSMFAFRVNPGFGRLQGFRIAAAHTDWPCMRIKPAPDMSQGPYGKLNVETWGTDFEYLAGPSAFCGGTGYAEGRGLFCACDQAGGL